MRGRLAAVLFGRDDVDKKLSSLSGGEAARMMFAKLAVLHPNVLVLDEPTNHLDFEGIEALAGALKEFDGTVIFVSHNRWFVDKLASRVLELKEDGITDYRGSYREYLAHCGDDHLDAESVVQRQRQDKGNKKKRGKGEANNKQAAPAGGDDKAGGKRRKKAGKKKSSRRTAPQ